MTPSARVVVKARRRFADNECVPNEESTKEDVPSPKKPLFTLNASFDPPAHTEEESKEKEKWTFQGSAKAAKEGETEKK